jgi:hypothetical protein
VQWAAQVAESGVHVQPTAVVVDAGGSAVVLWSRVPRPRPEDFPNPPLVVWAGLSRFDGQGRMMWNIRLPPQVGAGALALDGDGSVVLTAGVSTGGPAPDFGGGPFPADPGVPILLRYAPDGSFRSARPVPLAIGHNVGALVLDGAGGTFIAGTFGQERLFSFGVSFAQDLFVARVDSQAAVTWERRVSAVQQNDAITLARDGCGNLMLAGRGGERTFLVVLDPAGVPRDFRQIVAPSALPRERSLDDVGVTTVVPDAAGGLTVVGTVRNAAALAGREVRSANARLHDTFLLRW